MYACTAGRRRAGQDRAERARKPARGSVRPRQGWECAERGKRSKRSAISTAWLTAAVRWLS